MRGATDLILSDRTLRMWIKQKRLTVNPLTEEQIQPASIDLRLGTHFLIVKQSEENEIITMDTPTTYDSIECEEIIIPPLSFMLATTMETIRLPGYITAFVEGRSSVGRMGLFIQNAGWVDPGFEGKITLELFNASSHPIRLESGRRICQLVFSRMDRGAQNVYSGKYQGQYEAVGSRIFEDVMKVQKLPLQ